METSVKLVKYFDLFVGLPSIIYDNDVRRRTLYGKAGCFRLQEWGVECRILSAAMYATDALMKFVWNGVVRAIDAYNHGLKLPNPKQVREAIDNSNIDLARQILANYGINI